MAVDIGLSELPQTKPTEGSSRGAREKISEKTKSVARATKEKVQRKGAREALVDMAVKDEAATVPSKAPIFTEAQLKEEILFTEVQEAAAFLENKTVLQRSLDMMKKLGHTGHELVPSFAIGAAGFALDNLAGGVFSTHAAELLVAAATGGATALDGSNLRESLKNFNGKTMIRNATLAVLFTKGIVLSEAPVPKEIGGIADDALLPLLKALPALTIFPGGVK